jgi:hypothetical protein
MTTSWVIREKSTGKVICETFNPRAIAALNVDKYEEVPILDYLCFSFWPTFKRDESTQQPYRRCYWCGQGVTCAHGRCDVCQDCRKCDREEPKRRNT